jgi:glycolate oxidase iron-sulfur subunit
MSTTKTLAYEETFSCVQCGYCLPACPTYKTMKKETHSPRGRINLVKLAAEGKIAIEKLQDPIDLCLGCRACERVCPTNVQYGTILESAKEVLREKEKENQGFSLKNSFQQVLFKDVFPKKKNLSTVSHLLWFYQRTGLRKVAHSTGLINVLPKNLSAFEKITPAVTSPSARKKRLFHMKPEGEVKYRIGFFAGCVMDAMFDKINDLSMKLLVEGGCEVVVIPNQTCCGALHAHSGEMDMTKELAKQNIAAFEKEEVDFIVNTAGGCGAMLIEYDHILKDDPKWYERAKAFSKKSVDVSVVLSKLDLEVKNTVNKVVTYQPSCHMTNVQKSVKEPLSLLSSIVGVTLKRMDNEDMCCGSAGIYNIVNYEESIEILDEKMIDMKKTNPQAVVTTNPGCLLQMKLGIEREELHGKVEAVHLIELLAEAYLSEGRK